MFTTKFFFESHKKVYKNKDFCVVATPCKDTKTLEFNHYRLVHIIYVDLKFSIRKVDRYKINPEKSPTKK